MPKVRMDTFNSSLKVLIDKGLDADTARKIVEYALKLERGELESNPETDDAVFARTAFLLDGATVLGNNSQPVRITSEQALQYAISWDKDSEERRGRFFPSGSTLEALAIMADNIPRAVRNGGYSDARAKGLRTSGQVCAAIIASAPHLKEGCFEITRVDAYNVGPISEVTVKRPTVPQEGSVSYENEVTLGTEEYSVK